MRDFAILAATDAIAALANFFFVAMFLWFHKYVWRACAMSVQFCTHWPDVHHVNTYTSYVRCLTVLHCDKSAELQRQRVRFVQSYYAVLYQN